MGKRCRCFPFFMLSHLFWIKLMMFYILTNAIAKGVADRLNAGIGNLFSLRNSSYHVSELNNNSSQFLRSFKMAYINPENIGLCVL